jgi:phage shock protein A
MHLWQKIAQLMSRVIERPSAARTIERHLDDMAHTVASCREREVQLALEEEKVTRLMAQNASELEGHLRAARSCAARGQFDAARTHLKAKEKSERVGLELKLRHEDFHKQRESLIDAERDLVLYMDSVRSKKAMLAGQEDAAQVRLIISGEDGRGCGAGVKALLEEMESEVLHRHVRALLT